MTCIIVEDEKPASQKLLKALSKCAEPVEVVTILGSVSEAVNWLKNNVHPALVFMDIELSDGSAFEIFDQVTVSCPVIFTTAYDEYWQEAFENHGIDYLLKPIRQEKLETALNKYEKLKKYFAGSVELTDRGQKLSENGYKRRFLIKRGGDYISIKTEEIAYLYATHKLVCLVDSKAQKYILDDSLTDIERQLDPGQFYRVNRKYLVHLNAIDRIKSYPKSKLQLELKPSVNDDIIISQENVASFKVWMAK